MFIVFDTISLMRFTHHCRIHAVNDALAIDQKELDDQSIHVRQVLLYWKGVVVFVRF
jgi:hypothetical protein